MNNSDMPAMPLIEEPSSDIVEQAVCARMRVPRAIHYNGLTKKEAFAIKLMAGMAAGREYDGAAWKVMAGEAITGADALLSALENSK